MKEGEPFRVPSPADWASRPCHESEETARGSQVKRRAPVEKSATGNPRIAASPRDARENAATLAPARLRVMAQAARDERTVRRAEPPRQAGTVAIRLTARRASDLLSRSWPREQEGEVPAQPCVDLGSAGVSSSRTALPLSALDAIIGVGGPPAASASWGGSTAGRNDPDASRTGRVTPTTDDAEKRGCDGQRQSTCVWSGSAGRS